MLAGAGTIAATCGIGRTLGSPRLGLAAATLVVCCPAIILHARSFMFALPATCIATIAVFALLRSDRMRHTGWACLFGVCCGLLPLTRTMAIAFIPALLLGALLTTVATHPGRRTRSLRLLGSVLLAAAIAATWLWPNGRYAFAYLLSFGYGAHAADYGPAASPFSLVRLVALAQTLIRELYLPSASLLAAGALCLATLWLGCIARDGPGRAARRTLQAPILPLAIYIAGALAALASSANRGDGFFTPIVPSAIVLALWSCSRFARTPATRATAMTAAALVAAAGALPSLDLRLPVARPWMIILPLLGSLPVTDGRGYIGIYEAGGGFIGHDPARPVDRDSGRRWVALSTTLADVILRTVPADAPTAFGFRHYMVNVNTVSLAALAGAHRPLDLRQVDPVTTADTVAGDVAWLAHGDGATATLLLTAEGQRGEIQPIVDTTRMAQAAAQAGFHPTQTIATPTGEQIILWRRSR